MTTWFQLKVMTVSLCYTRVNRLHGKNNNCVCVNVCLQVVCLCLHMCPFMHVCEIMLEVPDFTHYAYKVGILYSPQNTQ